MRSRRNINLSRIFVWVVAFLFVMLSATSGWSNLYLNVLAMNASDESKEKEIVAVLPKEITAEDVLDTDGLELEYDVEQSAYVVKGKVLLNPKESKTFKILIKDLWQFDEAEIEKIRGQIDLSFSQLEGTDYAEIGKIKRQSLLQRLDFLLQEQQKYADNIEKRIDTYRMYGKELDSIRENASSIKYWRSKPPNLDKADIFYFVIELENKLDKAGISKQQFYLPAEVKPEHFVDLQDFEIRYDAIRQRSYLLKEEELQPKETKRFSVGIIDLWNIKQALVDNLKERARYAYKFIEPTKYVENAKFLMENIKKNTEAIEASQAREKNINEHISVYHKNFKRLESAQKDVEELEVLLEIIREELKRSKLENVLKKVRGLKSVVEIAESILKKPADKVAWNIIIVILAFVGILTIINFAIWGSRSKGIKTEEDEPKQSEKKE